MDDVGGVEYVSNLRIEGLPIMGSPITAEAEFVGEPSVQWYRSKGADKAVEIAGACGLQYTLTADDIGCVVRSIPASLRRSPRTFPHAHPHTHIRKCTSPSAPTPIHSHPPPCPAQVRVECVGPYGGAAVSAAISEVTAHPMCLSEVQKMMTAKGREKEIAVKTVPGDEPRILLITKDKVKLRSKRGR